MPALYEIVLAEHRRRLERLATRRAAGRLKDIYDRAQAELVRKVSRLGGGTPFTAHTLNLMMAQVKAGQIRLAAQMAGELGDVSKDAQVEALGGVITDIKRMERKFAGTTPVLRIEEASRFAGVIDQRRTSLLKMHKTSMARYGSLLVGQMEDQLSLGLASGDSTDEAIGRIQKTAGNEWWQAERIVRTETAWAYNATNADGVKAVRKDVPDIWQRWTEHVSDDGTPLDDRVGEDSIVMHGQVAEPGGRFTMPVDPKVHASLWNKSWLHPPNRPNDRAVLVPWSPRWGAPGWELKGGARRPVKV